MAPRTKKATPAKTTAAKATEAPPTDEAPPTEATESGDTKTETPEPKPTELLKVACRTALKERNDDGIIPTDAMDAARAAYRAVPRRERGDVATEIGAEMAAQMMLADGTMDAGHVVAMAQLTRMFADTNAASPQRTRDPHDPVAEVAALLATFDATEHVLNANLTDEQRKRVAELRTTDNPAGEATRERAAAKLTPLVKRALTGGPNRRPATRGERTGGPGRNLAEIVTAEVTGSDGPVMLATIARKHEVSTGALGNRWVKDNIKVNDVKTANAVEVDGRRAFAAA